MPGARIPTGSAARCSTASPSISPCSTPPPSRAGWGSPPPAGIFRGIALNEACESICAQVVEASVSDAGAVRVHRVISAIDCGHVVNPLTVELQTQSAVVFALTAALYGEITIADGRVQQSNFHDYEMLRMADMPRVETVMVPSGTRAARSGAASASRRSRRWRRRSATPSSRPPAGASARCR